MSNPEGPDPTGPDTRFSQPLADQVGRMAARSAKWAVLTIVLRQVVTLGATMIVARLITPGDTGVATLALVVMAFMVLLDTGLSWATVQPRELSKAQVDGMFWLGVGVGLGLWAVCGASGGALAEFFNVPQLALVMPVIGLAAFFNSLSTQPAALMKRQLRQKRVALVETGGLVVGAIVAVSAAVAGGGYWAMVLQFVAIHATRAILFHVVSGYRPAGPRVPRESWALALMGGGFALSNYVSFFQLYLGSLIVGRVFGAVDLGFYARANTLKAMPTQYAAMVVTDVMVASLAALKGDPERMAAAYRKALALTALIGCPAGAFLYVAGPELIALFYGPGWEGAEPMLRALAPAATMLPITTTTIWLFLATGRARAQFVMNVCLTIAVIVIFALGATLSRSATQFIFVEAVVSATLLSWVNIVVSHRSAKMSLRPTLGTFLPIMLAAALAAAITTGLFGVAGETVSGARNFSDSLIVISIKAGIYASIYGALVCAVSTKFAELRRVRKFIFSSFIQRHRGLLP